MWVYVYFKGELIQEVPLRCHDGVWVETDGAYAVYDHFLAKNGWPLDEDQLPTGMQDFMVQLLALASKLQVEQQMYILADGDLFTIRLEQ